MSAVIWRLGGLPGRAVAGSGHNRRLLLITVTISVISLVALVLSFAGPGRPVPLMPSARAAVSAAPPGPHPGPGNGMRRSADRVGLARPPWAWPTTGHTGRPLPGPPGWAGELVLVG